MLQHKNDVTSLKTDEHISGISKHARNCPNHVINWDKPEILATFNDKNKATLQRNLLLRENIEIRRHQTTTGNGLNDPQMCIRSNAWDPILYELRDTWFLVFGGHVGEGPESLSLSFLWIISFVLIWLILYCLSFSPYGQFPPYKFCLSLSLLFTVYELWVCQNARKFRLSLFNKCMWS